MDNISIEKYLEKINIEKAKPLTIGNLITNCIVSSKKLIFEIENIEDRVLKANEKDQNSLVILGAKLEILIQEIRRLSGDIF